MSAINDSGLCSVGERIRNARRALKMTQITFARAIGVSRATVIALENGQRRRINPERLRTIAALTEQPLELFYAALAIEEAVSSTMATQDETAGPSDALPIHAIYPLTSQSQTIIRRLSRLSQKHQERLGHVLEQVMAWYESDIAGGVTSAMNEHPDGRGAA
jgi:transcriptional regulator with XRE-family HTH domain